MSNLDTLRVRILEAFGQGLGHVQITTELVALCRLGNNLQLILFVQFVVICDNGPGGLVRVADGIGILGIER